MERALRADPASLYGSPAAAAVDRHWAVASVENARSVLATAMQASTAIHLGGDPVTGDDADRTIALASAYDLAGRDVLRRMREDRSSAESPDLREQLELAASRAAILYAVLPVPGAPEELAIRKLHLAALSHLAARSAHFARWRARHPLPEGHEDRPWPIWLLEQTTEVWCELLRGEDPPDATLVAERIARGRELQLVSERQYLATLLGPSVDRARLYLFALHHVMDAATDVFLYMRHHAPMQRRQVESVHFDLAVEATSGDARMDTMLTWLHAAAMRLMHRHSWQLGLPGMRD